MLFEAPCKGYKFFYLVVNVANINESLLVLKLTDKIELNQLNTNLILIRVTTTKQQAITKG